MIILKGVPVLLFIDARKYRNLAVRITYLVFAVVITFFTYTAIESRINTMPVEVQYKEYTGLGNSFSYKLPETWKVEPQKFSGDEIVYHSDYSSPDRKINGYIEIWNLNMPLLNFLKEGEKSAVGVVTYKYYTVEPIKIDGREGYVLQYSRKGEENRYIKAFEIFLNAKSPMFVRFAFYMDEQLWKDEYRQFFINIAAMSKLK